MHQVMWDVLHKLKSQGLRAHFPAAFQECVSIVGTVPPCQEDRVQVDPDCDCMSCYYPESIVIVLRGEVFIQDLQDLIKDHPKWNIDHLICVCIFRLHHHYRDAGIIAVLTDVLSYSSRALDNLVDYMYPQGAKPLWEIFPPGTQPVEYISTLVQNSDREVDLVEPTDAQRWWDMCAEHGLSFEGVTSQFTQLQKYTDFLDPSQMPPCHLFGPPPLVGHTP